MFNVYVLENTINEKMYVGATKNLKKRLSNHKSMSKKESAREKMVLYDDLNKHNWDNFNLVYVLSCDTKEEMKLMEEKLIKYFKTEYPNGYNVRIGYKMPCYMKEYLSIINSGENNPMFGKKQSDTTKKIIGEKKIGTKLSEETKEKMSKSSLGKHNYMFGKKHSDATKQKMSESSKNNKITCPHCGMVTNKGNAHRWHFDNCPSK